MTYPRWIELDGVVNMRDLGGLPTRDGGTIQERRLIRSDNLQDLTEADVAHVVDVLGVSDVVDLRTDDELAQTGPGPLRGTAIAHHHHTFFRAASGGLRDLLVLRDEEQPVRARLAGVVERCVEVTDLARVDVREAGQGGVRAVSHAPILP